MTFRYLSAAALALAATSLAGAAVAASANAGATIAARKANFKDMGKGTKAVFDQLKSSAPDLAVIRAGADAIDRAAPKVAGFFPAGTGPEARIKTGALPAIWQKNDEFKADAQKLVDAAHGLKAATASGDMGKIKAAAMTLGGTCKSCHDTFRMKD